MPEQVIETRVNNQSNQSERQNSLAVEVLPLIQRLSEMRAFNQGGYINRSKLTNALTSLLKAEVENDSSLKDLIMDLDLTSEEEVKQLGEEEVKEESKAPVEEDAKMIDTTDERALRR